MQPAQERGQVIYQQPVCSGKRALKSAHTRCVGPETIGTNVFQAMLQSRFGVNPPYIPPSLPLWNGNVYSIPFYLGNVFVYNFTGAYSYEFSVHLEGEF